MKKVAHICTSSASHKILVDKLSLLQKKGYDVHIISSKEGYNHDLMKNYNFTLKFIHMKRYINIFSDILSVFRLMKLFRKERYNIVHTHNAKAGIIGRIAAKLTGIRVIIHTSHGLPFYEKQGTVKNRVYRAFEKIGSYFCDAIASQNKEDIKKIKELAPNKSVYYEGNGVNLHLLDHIRKHITFNDLKKLREQLTISDHTKIILVGARFEPVKDHYFLLEGLKELKNHQQNFVCILAGQGILEEKIKFLIHEFGLNNHVKIVGYQTNIYPYIEISDIVALTSEKEGIPRILMEAMAFSKPVIASDVLGTRELVMHRKSGLLVEYKNIKQLASAFDQLITNESLREEFGSAGREIIENEFTEEMVVDRIISMYKNVRKSTGIN